VILSRLKEKVLRTIETYHDEIVDFTARLIAVPTANPPGGAYRECVDVIARKLAEIGLEYSLVEVPADTHPDFRSFRDIVFSARSARKGAPASSRAGPLFGDGTDRVATERPRLPLACST